MPESIPDPLFPVFLRLSGRRVVVVGGGPTAVAKVHALVRAGATVTVIAPSIEPGLRGTGAVLLDRPFVPEDLDGAWFVIAAATPDVNRSVCAAGESRGIFVNAVDDREQATAFLGGVVRKAGLTLAVSTDGLAPALAGLVREALEALLPDDLHRWLEVSARERAGWKSRGLEHSKRRPLLLAALNRIYTGESGGAS